MNDKSIRPKKWKVCNVDFLWSEYIYVGLKDAGAVLTPTGMWRTQGSVLHTVLLSTSQVHVTMSGPWCLCPTHKLLFLNGLLLCDINFMDLGLKPCKWETNACHTNVALESCLRSLGMSWVYRSCGLPLLCPSRYHWAIHPVLPFLLYWRHLVHHVIP